LLALCGFRELLDLERRAIVSEGGRMRLFIDLRERDDSRPRRHAVPPPPIAGTQEVDTEIEDHSSEPGLLASRFRRILGSPQLNPDQRLGHDVLRVLPGECAPEPRQE
jgi:hypothetical protein